VARRAKILLPDLGAAHAFAGRLAGLLRPGDVVGLSGPLGCGKTEIARAAIRARAGAAIEVPSPSFTLVQDYPLLIEWPERAAGLLPEDRLEIRIDQGEAADARELELIAGRSWSARLETLADG
jgi:tRNA threonylcarbamoyladenosine biosynthesis protein TsaE